MWRKPKITPLCEECPRLASEKRTSEHAVKKQVNSPPQQELMFVGMDGVCCLVAFDQLASALEVMAHGGASLRCFLEHVFGQLGPNYLVRATVQSD